MNPPSPSPFSFHLSRRDFLQTAAAGLALSALGAHGAELINERPKRVGLIGAGWYGKSDLWRLLQVAPRAQVVGLADPDRHMLDEAVAIHGQRRPRDPRPRAYGDYREMLAQEGCDLVLVGSPDHWHALQAIAAMEAGADVYLQKPISVDVLEGEAILATARRLGRVVQIGTQRRSTPHLIDAKREIVETGRLGRIGHVELCCYFPMRPLNSPPVVPVPDHLDYEMWTGPAPLRPYDGLPHLRWRGFMEYGNGIVGDMCVHMLDTARWMLGLGWPRRISSAGGIYVQTAGTSNITDTQTATFEFEGLTCVWQHRTWGVPPDPAYPWALFLHGEHGVLKASTVRAEFIPYDRNARPVHFDCVYEREKFPEDATEQRIELNAAPATRRQLLDFLRAVESRGRPVADVEEGHISTASCILANVAMKLGRTLAYDPATRCVPGDAEATALLQRAYRAPWQRPALE
jgi:predicted dehydrogenase